MGLLCTRQRKLQFHDRIFTVTLPPQKTSPSFHQFHPLNGLPIISFFQRKFSIFRKYNFSVICFVSTSAKFGISTDMGLNGTHIKCAHTSVPFRSTLQRQFRLYIPFLGIARPQLQFPHSYVCERFIYSQDRSTYFLQQKRQTHHGNIQFAHRHMNVEIRTETRYSFSGNICFKFSAFCLCSACRRR